MLPGARGTPRPAAHARRSRQRTPEGSPDAARGPANSCTRTGRRLSRDAVAQRLSIHAQAAAQDCPFLLDKSIHPHVLRHSCAMSLLQAGVDTTVLAFLDRL
jgi:site-specific recombinase XerD